MYRSKRLKVPNRVISVTLDMRDGRGLVKKSKSIKTIVKEEEEALRRLGLLSSSTARTRAQPSASAEESSTQPGDILQNTSGKGKKRKRSSSTASQSNEDDETKHQLGIQESQPDVPATSNPDCNPTPSTSRGAGDVNPAHGSPSTSTAASTPSSHTAPAASDPSDSKAPRPV